MISQPPLQKKILIVISVFRIRFLLLLTRSSFIFPLQCCGSGSGSVWIRFIWPDPDPDTDPFQTIRIRIRVQESNFSEIVHFRAKF